jgi:hypothetical protein
MVFMAAAAAVVADDAAGKEHEREADEDVFCDCHVKSPGARRRRQS